MRQQEAHVASTVFWGMFTAVLVEVIVSIFIVNGGNVLLSNIPKHST
jgi:hypothetical protein